MAQDEEIDINDIYKNIKEKRKQLGIVVDTLKYKKLPTKIVNTGIKYLVGMNGIIVYR